jgi:hypothetical protein
MAEDSAWFRTAPELTAAGYRHVGADWVPSVESEGLDEYVSLYEAKMFGFYDHRFGSYGERGSERRYRVLPQTSVDQYVDPNFEPEPFYYVPKREVDSRLAGLWSHNWLIACKKVTAATNERTTTVTILPKVAVGDSASLLFPSVTPKETVGLVADLNSLVLDYVARNKVGGLNLSAGILEQFPVLPPSFYTPADLAFIVSRVVELTYTSHSLASFARDLGYHGLPFKWEEERRAQLRAELDAVYAHAYGLTRDELRYILDPADVKGPDYPSETFRVLKKNEIAKWGEYRTARLVLAAYDEQSTTSAAAE